jgi:hypothetical protein
MSRRLPSGSNVHIIESGRYRVRLKLDVGMRGLGDLVAGFDEGGSNMRGAGGQEGFAVILNFLVQSPMTHHNGQFGKSDV